MDDDTSSPSSFHAFSSTWLARISRRIAPATHKDYEWRLCTHLLPFFSGYDLAEIDGKLIERYRESKLAQNQELERRLASGERIVDSRGCPIRPLSDRTIDMTLALLSRILKSAVMQGLIDEHPAVGARLPAAAVSAPGRRWLMPDELLELLQAAERVDHAAGSSTRERARQIQALLSRPGCTLSQAASELGLAISTASRLARMRLPDREPSVRRTIIAAAALSGLRVEEMYALRWCDLDFMPARIAVRAGARGTVVRMLPVGAFLRAELVRWKNVAPSRHHYKLVFPATGGALRGKNNLRKRVLAPVLEEASRARRQDGRPPLPDGIAPEWLRRTFVALHLASGADLSVVRRQADIDVPALASIHAQVAQTDFLASAALLDRFCEASRYASSVGRRVRFASA